MIYMEKAEHTIKTAPCGCTFRGRFVTNEQCTVLDRSTATGSQQIRHSISARKKAR